MGTFLRFWAESEELIYKMCNDVGDPIRAGTLTNTKKGTKQIKHETSTYKKVWQAQQARK